MIRTFIYAWLQVSLIAANTYQIANQKWLGALIVGFFISLIWTFNVRRIAFGGMTDRIVYSTGAMCGTATGIALTYLLY